MHPRQFDALGERLLRSGIAPRHVRRYLQELRDHYDDAVQNELRNGASHAGAEDAAAKRLSDPDHLYQSALARPELRSMIARYATLILTTAPVLIWAVVSVFVFSLLAQMTLSTEGMWITYGSTVLLVRVLPVVLALGVLIIAFRQRLPLFWPIVGAAVVSILAGTLNVTYLPAQSLADSSLGIDSSLLPFFFDSPVLGPAQPAALVQGLMRAVLTLAIAGMPFMLWSHRQRQA